MSASRIQEEYFVEPLIKLAAADFLESFSQLLLAASLLERRPRTACENPDIARAVENATSLLLSAYERFRLLAAGLGSNADEAGGAGGAARRSVDDVIAAAIADRVLTDYPPAVKLLCREISSHNAQEVIATFIPELRSCVRAIRRLDLQATDLVSRIQAVESAYIDAMVKGQYVAYVNRVD